MNVRRLHRVLGLILLLPILGWAVTGFIFFVKPGYGPAYAMLRVRTLELEPGSGSALTTLRREPGWLEMRALRTVLGDHLLVRNESGWSQLDPATFAPRPLPAAKDLRALIEDAIAADPAHEPRYGSIASLESREDGSGTATATTSTGVTIDLDWATLSLSQSGRDTRRIDRLYRIHYLQWTGIKTVDRVVGITGLVALVGLAFFGLRLAFPRRLPT